MLIKKHLKSCPAPDINVPEIEKYLYWYLHLQVPGKFSFFGYPKNLSDLSGPIYVSALNLVFPLSICLAIWHDFDHDKK